MRVRTLNSTKRMFLGIINLIILVVIIIVGLWPFNFCPQNKVRWLKDQNGIQFYGQAIIFSEASLAITLPLPSAPSALCSLSIELWLQPGSEPIGNLPRIFSIYNRSEPESFFIGQWRSHLIVGKGIHGRQGYREMGVRNILKKGERKFVAITSGADGTRIYVGGTLSKANPRFYLFSTDQKPSGQILLGNSPTGNQYWTGDLFGLAIYDRLLTEHEVFQHFQDWEKKNESSFIREEGIVALYPFDEHSGTLANDRIGRNHLLIPSRLEVLQKTVLTPPWKDFRLNRSYLMDILTNILGFIPFGFFFSAYLRTQKYRSGYEVLLICILLAGCISLSIEIIQVYLPTRSSQLTDVITNILGTAIGVALFIKYRKGFGV